jgi:hypothetical protein
MRYAQRKVAKRKAVAEFDRPLRGEDGLIEPIRKIADVGEREMCVRIPLVEIDSVKRSLQSFLPLRRRVLRPAIRD